MSRPTPPIVDAPTADTAVREGIERLQQILTSVDTFLAGWWERYGNPANVHPHINHPPIAVPNELGTASPDTSPASTDAAKSSLAQRIAQFESEKSQWKAQRDSEAQRLAEKFDQLAKGWLHLEAERRTLLQTQQAQRSRRPSARKDIVGGHMPSDVASNDRQPFVQPSPVNPVQQNRVPLSGQTGGRADEAVQQFQQLRRQIDSRREPRDQP
ncbi:hypothetical protein [Roseimaritima ulvae]|nr:hypothetical protein [Roseimaritima ulvae]